MKLRTPQMGEKFLFIRGNKLLKKFFRFSWALGLGLALFNCALFVPLGEKGNGHQIERMANLRDPSILLEYQDSLFCLKNLKEKSDLLMWSDSQLKKKITLIPPGGFFNITVKRIRQKEVNKENFRMVIKKDGKVYMRPEGETGESDYFMGGDRAVNAFYGRYSSGYWTQELIFPVKQKLIHPVEVYIIDLPKKIRYIWKVH